MNAGRARVLFFSFFLVSISITFTVTAMSAINKKSDKLKEDVRLIKKDNAAMKKMLYESSATLGDIKKRVYQINERRRRMIKWAALPDGGGSWISRIDGYLAGTSLAGQGRAFYLAAIDYEVEPRLSPAIAMVESGAGAATPGGHNYWGMTAGTVPWRTAIKARDGSSGQLLLWQAWPDKKTAIREHTEFIAKKWGRVRSPYEMKGYAVPSGLWAQKVSKEMEKI